MPLFRPLEKGQPSGCQFLPAPIETLCRDLRGLISSYQDGWTTGVHRYRLLQLGQNSSKEVCRDENLWERHAKAERRVDHQDPSECWRAAATHVGIMVGLQVPTNLVSGKNFPIAC